MEGNIRFARHLGLRAAQCTCGLALSLLAMALAGCAFEGTGTQVVTSEAATADAATNEASTTSAAATTTDATPVQQHGALHVDGTVIKDEHGDTFQVKGVSTHGLAWFPQFANEEAFSSWRDWGANTIRLALYTEESGGYCTVDDAGKANLLSTLEGAVDAATRAGMYVIIDWHTLSDSDPTTNEDAAKGFFSTVSARYAGQDNVIYEICNEPNGSTTWEQVRAYAEAVLPSVRANAPDALVAVGTPTWCQDVDAVASDPIEDANVVYTLHFYAATHGQAIRDKLTAALDAGTPVLVSEFGICDASGNGSIDSDSANAWLDLLDARGVGYVCWNLSNKDEASALLKSTCAATGGWGDDDLSAEGTWYKARLGGSGDASTAVASGGTGAVAAGTVSSGATSTVVATLTPGSTWEADGKQYAQYDLTVANDGQSDATGWGIVVAFQDAVELSDGWCADYVADGSTLTVKPASYVATLAAGASTSQIGFIVCGNQAPVVSSVTVTGA
jgi:endoglucanase